MFKAPVNFLLLRLSAVLLVILILAFFSMSNAIYIAEIIQGQAGAINESGKLRMRSYRIANNLLPDYWDSLEHWKLTTALIQDFEKNLTSARLTDALPPDQDSSQKVAYDAIKQQWFSEIRPLFDLYLEGIVPPAMSITEGAIIDIRNRYLLNVENFVSNIDGLVTLLEQDMELKIHQLHKYQFIALILTLILVIVALLLIWRYLILPLKQLLIAAERTAKADFSFRTAYTGKDELGRLGLSFNTMSEELAGLYKSLEQRVQDKTKVLERSNQTLEFLYQTAKVFNSAASPQENFHQVLQQLEQLTGLGHGSICLRTRDNKNDNSEAVMVVSTYQSTDYGQQLCKLFDCNDCLSKDFNQHNVSLNSEEEKTVVTVAIRDDMQQYGVLAMQLNDNTPLESWQIQLLESATQQMATAIGKARIEAELGKVALMEERSIIARELHDSLAQSLTFMKIQVSRLNAITQQKSDQPAYQEKTSADTSRIINELRSGLNAAYKELRQLLNTFRLKPDTDDFSQTLAETVSYLSQQGETAIILDNQLSFCDFTANEEIHLQQIIREALSNVIQHAKAKKAQVILRYQHNQVSISIEDDGVGISSQPERTDHYGLVSIRERTLELGGSLDISTKVTGGTRIALLFKPTHKMNPVTS